MESHNVIEWDFVEYVGDCAGNISNQTEESTGRLGRVIVLYAVIQGRGIRLGMIA